MMQDLPPGFRLDPVSPGPVSADGLPPGFRLDQPQRPAQPRPQAAPPATPAPVLNELGITDAQERDALIYQGYTPEEADRLMQENYVARSGPVVGYGVAREEELSPQDTPESLRAQGYEIDPVTNQWVRTVGRQQAPGAPAPLLPKLSELAARQAAEASLSQGEGTGLSDRVRAVSSGLSFGLSDELERALVEAQTRGENLNRRILGQEIPFTASQYGSAYEDLARGRANEFAQERPLQNFALQMAGGAFAPGMSAAGNYVTQGATGGIRAGRAAGVGAGIGGATGFGTAEGGLADRLESGAIGAGVGALTGAAGQRVVDRFARGAVGADTTAARQLSREGVQLTPGQMLQEMPLVGGIIRGTEDRMAGMPLVGDVIQGARTRGLETANMASVNRALGPIGESVPPKIAPGYDAVEYAQGRLGQAYADVLSRVNVTVDDQLRTRIAEVLSDAPASMGEDRARQLAEILSSRVMRNVDESGAIAGDEFKRIETVLGQQQRELTRSVDGDQRALGQALGEIRGEFRDALARQNPIEAPRLQQINTGYANLVRVEDATGAAGSMAREGVFTPAQLAAAVRRNTGSRSQRGAGTGLMRDLATNMGEVLPSTVPDTGTAGRGLLGALLGGAVALKPEIAIPVVIGASAPYTKIGQSLINTIYRATDPEQARPALAEMARLAQQNPELQQYYAQAAEHVARLALPDAQNPPQPTLQVQQ